MPQQSECCLRSAYRTGFVNLSTCSATVARLSQAFACAFSLLYAQFTGNLLLTAWPLGEKVRQLLDEGREHVQRFSPIPVINDAHRRYTHCVFRLVRQGQLGR